MAVVAFDPEDVDTAYAELDARWTAGEATTHPLASTWIADYLRAFAARDWTMMAALFTPDLLGENHRLVGWGTLRGPAAIVSTLQAQIDLAPDTQERVDHVRTGERAVLLEYAWHGTREGGAFENVWVVLVELYSDGRGRRADVWDPEQLEESARALRSAARAHHPDPLASRSPTRRPRRSTAGRYSRPASSRTGTRWGELRVGDDPRGPAGFRPSLRRPRADDRLLARASGERGARAERRLMGTAGERVAIVRMLWSGGPSDGRLRSST